METRFLIDIRTLCHESREALGYTSCDERINFIGLSGLHPTIRVPARAEPGGPNALAGRVRWAGPSPTPTNRRQPTEESGRGAPAMMGPVWSMHAGNCIRRYRFQQAAANRLVRKRKLANRARAVGCNNSTHGHVSAQYPRC